MPFASAISFRLESCGHARSEQEDELNTQRESEGRKVAHVWAIVIVDTHIWSQGKKENGTRDVAVEQYSPV
jgi:hypothetical protein